MSTKHFHKAQNLLLSMLLPLGIWLSASCTNEVDDYFELSASQRLAATVDHARQVLRSAQYGWELEYYPGSTLEYGGVVYTVKFDSLTATVACSLIPDSTSTTYYRLTNDNGPVLTFDTYNPLLHYFSTPSSDEYEAKGGEFEFVLDSIADDYISLYGKKTRNTMYLRRLKESPEEYARKTINIFDHFVDSIRGTVGTAELVGKCNPSNRSISIVSGGDTLDVHYAFTDRGISLYRPLLVGGVSMQTFAFDVATNELTCLDEGAEGVTLQGIPYSSKFMNYSRWESDYDLTWGSSSSAKVHLKPNRLEGTYLMQGLSPMYDVVMRYDFETGNLLMGSQVIGYADGRQIYWSCVNYTGTGLSNISVTDEGQFTISWNGNMAYPRFNIKPTNGANYNSVVLIYLYYTEEGQLTADIMTDTEWMANGTSYLLDNLKTLNRPPYSM